MTLIFGNKSGLWADKKITQSHINDGEKTKIVKLKDGTLFGTAGTVIDLVLIQEIYNHFLSSTPNGIDSIIEAINFINTIKDNCNYLNEKGKKINNEFIIINDKVQLIFEQSGNPLTFDSIKKPYLSIGSGCVDLEKLLLIADKKNVNLEPEDIFEIVSCLDYCTGNEFDFIPYEKE